MRRRGRSRAAALAAALALAGCAGSEAPQEAPPPAAAGSLPLPSALDGPGSAGGALIDPEAVRAAPAVYMSLEADPGRPVSIVFAIDAAGDADPSDEPAMRLTPEGGRCNPQELSRYGARGGDGPVFGPEVARRGVDPRQLPEFMAVAVSRRMIDQGLAAAPEDTRPQNVCTRKLWERLAVAQTQAAAGQR